MTIDTCETTWFVDRDMPSAERLEVAGGHLVVYTSRRPGAEGPNQDAAAVIRLADRHCVVALADGFGGHAAGADAARTTVRAVEACVCRAASDGDNLRGGIVDGFESANRQVIALGVGAATTLAVVDIDDGRIRTYHAGDSAIVLTGQRGRIKLRTVAHSPVGYAVESGLIPETAAINHDQRHVVSNMVGTTEMSIEIGSVIELARRDTLIAGSDGVFDNLLFDEIVDRLRVGQMERGVDAVSTLAHRRMASPPATRPSKPDDLTLVAFRRIGG